MIRTSKVLIGFNLIQLNLEEAQMVRAMDDEVDEMHRNLYHLAEENIRSHPDRTGIFLQLLSLSRYLERIADLATNIAEDVIYMVEGTIARHSPESIKMDETRNWTLHPLNLTMKFIFRFLKMNRKVQAIQGRKQGL